MGRTETAESSLLPRDPKIPEIGDRESSLLVRALDGTAGSGRRSELTHSANNKNLPDSNLTNLIIVDGSAGVLMPQDIRSGSGLERPAVKQADRAAGSLDVPAAPLDIKTSNRDGNAEARGPENVSIREFGPNVTLDANNQISKISYPAEHKTREFGRDENGEINKLTTTTPRGKFDYVKENGSWFYLEPGKGKRPYDSMSIDANGEFSRVIRDGVALTQRPDGLSFEEEMSALGVRMSRNDEGQPEVIKRPDGTQFNASYQDGKLTKLVEFEDGKTTSWTPDKSGQWISDQKPSPAVHNLRIERNGNLRYSVDDVKHIIRSNGAKLEEGPGRSHYTFDEQGRFESISSPDGRRTRSFSYDGDSDKPSQIKITDLDKNEVRRYVHEPEKGGWTLLNNENQSLGTWKGEVRIDDDGTYSIKAANAKNDAWLVYHTDGVTQLESRRENGTLNIHNPAGDVIGAMRADGTVIKADYDAKGLSVVSRENQNGDKVNWQRQPDGTWKSDSPDFSGALKNVSINLDGEISIVESNNSRTTLKADGTSHMVKADGSFVDADSDWNVRRVGVDERNYRTLDYQNGELAKITDVTASGAKVWQRKPEGEEPRRDIRVSADGYVSYRLNGKTVVEGSNLSRMELKDNMSVARVTLPNGSGRDYSYDRSGALDTITDRRVTPNGVRSEVWKKVAEGEDGSNSFENRTNSGGLRVRKDVYVEESGDYLYRSGDGKAHAARVWDLSVDQEQQRERARQNGGNRPAHDGLRPASPADPAPFQSRGPSTPADDTSDRPTDDTQFRSKGATQSRSADGTHSRSTNGTASSPTDGTQSRSTDGTQFRPADGAQSRPTGGPQSRSTDGPKSRPSDSVPRQAATTESLNEVTDHSFQLKGYMLPSPDQLGAGSCLYMSATGIAEYLLNKSKGIAHPQPGGETDLSEQWTINLSKRVQLGNNYTDAPELLARGGAIPDSRLKFKAYASSTWMNEPAFNINGAEALPPMKKEVLFTTGGEGSQNSYGRMRPQDLDRIKQYLRKNESPVLFVYKPPTTNYWHANIITGYNDKTQSFTVRDSSFGDKVANAPAYNYDGRSPWGAQKYRNETQMPYSQVLQWGNHATGYSLAEQHDPRLVANSR